MSHCIAELFLRSHSLFWVIRYDGTVDPDDTFSSIPYEKGYSLLWYLETILGVQSFEAFLKGWGQLRSS